MNETMKIVVMGGSFNPPTIAHLKLICAAMDGIGAQKGIFVPSNHTYVKIKMRRAKHPDEVYSEEIRKSMIEAMCTEDVRLEVDTVEYTREKGKTYETMEHIQTRYPDAELYFVVGGDKLNVLSKWHRWREFMEHFRFVVFGRSGVNPMNQIFGNERLREYKHIFTILPYPQEVDGISSTEVRERIRNGRSAADLLQAGVWRLIEEHGNFQKKEEKKNGS